LRVPALHPEERLRDAGLGPPLRAEMPENPGVLKPTCARAEMIMAEISGDVACRESQTRCPF
jgi:hypothetical protein